MGSESACETIIGLPPPSLRPYVAAYGGFRTDAAGPLSHRVLPLSLTTMIVDFSTTSLVMGPRSTHLVYQRGWSYGIASGLTRVGVSALLGPPMRELADVSEPLEDLLGHRAVR